MIRDSVDFRCLVGTYLHLPSRVVEHSPAGRIKLIPKYITKSTVKERIIAGVGGCLWSIVQY